MINQKKLAAINGFRINSINSQILFKEKIDGFTLLEVLAVLTVIAIIAAFSMSSFVSKIAYHQTRESALIMLTTIKLCRSQSITSLENISCRIRIDDGLRTEVSVDDNQDNVFEKLITARTFRGTQYVNFRNSVNTFPLEIIFDSSGQATTGAIQIKVCNIQQNASPSLYQLNLNDSGVINMEPMNNVACR